MNYCLTIFGTFGIPNGFTQTSFLNNKKVNLPIQRFDLPTNAIKLFPNTWVFALKKEQVKGACYVSYALYSHAKELESNRGGTFIGTAITSNNCFLNEQKVVKVLKDRLTELKQKNVNRENRLVVKHSDDFVFSGVDSLNNINTNSLQVTDVNFYKSGKTILVKSEGNLVKSIQEGVELLNLYDTIYFTVSIDIINYVKNSYIPIIDEKEGLKQELYKIHKKRKEKLESLKQNVSQWSNGVVGALKQNKKFLKQQEELHQKNEEVHQKNKRYLEEYANKIKENKQKIEPEFTKIRALLKQYDNKGVPSWSELKQLEKEIKQEKNNIEQKQSELNKTKPNITPLNAIEKPKTTTRSNDNGLGYGNGVLPTGWQSPTLPNKSRRKGGFAHLITKSKIVVIAILLTLSLLFIGGVGWLGYSFLFGENTKNKETETKPKESKSTKRKEASLSKEVLSKKISEPKKTNSMSKTSELRQKE